MKINYERLEEELSRKGFDIDKINDNASTPIEEKIKPLLLVLNHFGYETDSSCEGHTLEKFRKRFKLNKNDSYREEGYQFVIEKFVDGEKVDVYYTTEPNVQLRLSPEKFNKLESIIKEYNSLNEIPWELNEFDGVANLSPHYNHPLEELQAEIPKISEFIYLNHKE
jgi:hypothetical protein